MGRGSTHSCCVSTLTSGACEQRSDPAQLDFLHGRVPRVGAVGAGLSFVNPDTGTITPVSRPKIAQTWGGIDVSPDWSEIAFPRRVDGRLQIFVMGADGKGVRQLTHQPQGAWSPAWSPSGNEIAFASDVGSGSDLFVMDADGSSVLRVTRTKDILVPSLRRW